MNEQLHKDQINPEVAEVINQITRSTIQTVMKFLPDDTGYSKTNLLLNVLLGGLCHIMSQVPPELRGTFIQGVNDNLEINRQQFTKDEV